MATLYGGFIWRVKGAHLFKDGKQENIATDQGEKIKDNFDKSALPHDFKINDLVWYEDFTPLGKNAKLTPKWQGPAKITEINDTNFLAIKVLKIEYNK